jgi:iron complex transport system permease protein
VLSPALPVAAMIGALRFGRTADPRRRGAREPADPHSAGLAVSSLAGAGTSLALNLAPNPFAALEIAFWLLGSLEDRSMRHVLIAAPFMAVSWALLIADGRAFRALTLGVDAAASLGVRLVPPVILGVAAGVARGGVRHHRLHRLVARIWFARSRHDLGGCCVVALVGAALPSRRRRADPVAE